MTQFNHPFNDKSCAERLLWEYQNYDHLYVGVDFDNTVKPVKESSSCEEVLELLRRCSADPKITLCLWSICHSEEEIEAKVSFLESQGIIIDYVNDSPFDWGKEFNHKRYFNVLLDDRAGLESAYNNLKYVLDNVENKFSKTREK